MTILDEIIAHKRQEVAAAKGLTVVRNLERSRFFSRDNISLSGFLTDSSKTGIIAEFKRMSPSKGIINSKASVVDVTSGYYRGGASGVSVLTDSRFFGGSSDDLSLARENLLIPVLRKDFIIDECQVIESKAIGADAILLIAAVLGRKDVSKLSQLARSIGLEVVLEIHEPNELGMINEFVNIIGVNNRNLKTFEVAVETSEDIIDRIPSGFLKISESGISSPQMIKRLRKAGYNGFLIGECFMSSSDPAKAFSGFVKMLT